MKKVFLFLSVLLIIYSNGYSQNDFFPLSTGNYFKYYYNANTFTNIGIFESEITTENGTVEYEVLSLTVKDSLFEWYIKETDSLGIRFFNPMSGIDTTYRLDTIYHHLLIQKRDSFNKILFSPKHEIWASPTLYHIGVPIYRYSFKDSILNLGQCYYINMSSYDDTLIFKKNIGFIKGKGSKGTNMGGYSYSHSWEAELIDYSIATKVEQDENLPLDFELLQNYPNPFNPSTTIEFSIPEKGNVVLKIFDILGNEITTLINEDKTAGSHSVVFGANNLPTGIYFYKIRAGNYTATRKLMLLK